MSDSQNQAAKYVVYHAENSAIGDYAQVINNHFPGPAATADPGVAELRRLFEQVYEKLAALETAEQELLAPAVAQAAKTTAEIQQGDDSPEKQTFLEARLKAIYAMRRDIGEVIITSLASPAAGIALTLQKIAQKAKGEVGLG
jgi:hypothetical protein